MKKCTPCIVILISLTCFWLTGSKANITDILYAEPEPNQDTIPKTGGFYYRIIERPDNSYGYEIFRDAKKIIRQESVPGRAGNGGFNTQGDAVKVAALVVKKLQNNIFPPTITAQELKQLRIK